MTKATNFTTQMKWKWARRSKTPTPLTTCFVSLPRQSGGVIRIRRMHLIYLCFGPITFILFSWLLWPFGSRLKTDYFFCSSRSNGYLLDNQGKQLLQRFLLSFGTFRVCLRSILNSVRLKFSSFNSKCLRFSQTWSRSVLIWKNRWVQLKKAFARWPATNQGNCFCLSLFPK